MGKVLPCIPLLRPQFPNDQYYQSTLEMPTDCLLSVLPGYNLALVHIIPELNFQWNFSGPVKFLATLRIKNLGEIHSSVFFKSIQNKSSLNRKDEIYCLLTSN